MLKLYQVDTYHTRFSLRIPLKFHIVFIHHAFLTVTVSLTLFLMTLIVLRITSQIFVKRKKERKEKSLNRYFSDILLMIQLGLWVL